MSNIKTNRAKLLSFKRELKEMGTKRDVKVMKLGEDPLLEKALYQWFQTALNLPYMYREDLVEVNSAQIH